MPGFIEALRAEKDEEIMDDIIRNIIPLAMGAVAIILVLGLWTVLRGENPNRSQRLMRWRIGLQFLAICLLMAAIYFTSRT